MNLEHRSEYHASKLKHGWTKQAMTRKLFTMFTFINIVISYEVIGEVTHIKYSV